MGRILTFLSNLKKLTSCCKQKPKELKFDNNKLNLIDDDDDLRVIFTH